MYAQGTLWSIPMAGRTSVRLTMCALCVMIRSKHELVHSVILVAESVSWKSWCTFRMSIRCCEGLLKKSVLKSPSITNFTTQLLALILSLISSQQLALKFSGR